MAVCYDDKGNEDSSLYTCSQDGSPAQCCQIGDSCASNGLCVNDNGHTKYAIRGCSVQDWTDGQVDTCIAQCLPTGGVGVSDCGVGEFCCFGFGGCDCNNSTETFNLDPVSIVGKITNETISSTTSSITSPTSTPTSDPGTGSGSGSGSGDSDSSSALPIGLGVGLGVGIPLLLAIIIGAFFFLRRRRNAAVPIYDKAPAYDQHQSPPVPSTHAGSDGGWYQSPPASDVHAGGGYFQKPPAQSYNDPQSYNSTPAFELPTRQDPAELQ
ncbi:hypothetical protein BJY04DRAFT_220059 [Aspergillus karnatakaensis]|uniref:resistance to Congo red protein n=1 Tax=Aspergillus karnatakaensis TaxID=1810916 RepID=UPI003CCCF339